MNDLLGNRPAAARRLVVWALGVVLLFASPSFAETIIDTGFEAATYVAGSPLEGHGGWLKDASDSTATVLSSVGTSLSQGVEVSRAANDNAYWYIPSPTYPSGYPSSPDRYIDISWDMKVSIATEVQGVDYGPFFGVVASQDDRSTIKWFGALGVDATTGELLYTGGTNGALTVIGDPSETVGFDEWHNYKIRLDFQTSMYSLYKDNVNLLANLPFVDSGLSCFTDADIMATEADGNGATATGHAYYDNFKVTAVPEPSTLVMCLAALLTLTWGAARRRR